MIQREKRYVEVDVRFSTEGLLCPLQIILRNRQAYTIRRTKDIARRAAELRGAAIIEESPDAREMLRTHRAISLS